MEKQQTSVHSSTNEIVALFRVMHKCLRRYGAELIIKKLQLIDDENAASNDLINHILKNVSEEFKVSINDIKFTKKRGIVTDAKRMCYILFSIHLSSSNAAIGRYFNRSATIVQFAKDEFLDMQQSAKVKHEIEFVQKYNRLSVKIEDFKKTIIAPSHITTKKLKSNKKSESDGI